MKKMNNSLYTLLNEQVLSEGRKEDVMAKYPNVDKSQIERLSQNDPSGNNKYLEYMVKNLSEGRRFDEIVSTIRDFHQKLPLISKQNIQDYANESRGSWRGSDFERFEKSPKDAMSYPGVQYMAHFLNFLNNVSTKKKEADQMKKEQDRIFEDENLLVTSPKTHNASCHYGKHSAWCVATANTGHFASYTKNGTLYFFISKKDKAYTRYWADKDNGQPPYKTALLLKDNGQASWWSKGDSNYANDLNTNNELLRPFFTEEIKSKILAHSKHVIETRKQREIERILIGRGFYKRNGDSQSKQDFTGFVRTKIFSPEQVVKIIKNDNWLALYENSEAGKLVREQLDPQTIFALTKEMISSSGEIGTLLKETSGQDFLTPMSEKFSEEQNRELAKLIETRMGHKPTSGEVGGDVKMFVDKWTMTPEAWAKYDATTAYFYIGDESGMYVEGLMKGDRFNPKDHQLLQMMMLKTKVGRNGLYALTTEKGLLDQWIGKPASEIPGEIKQSMKEKAKKLG